MKWGNDNASQGSEDEVSPGFWLEQTQQNYEFDPLEAF